MADGVRAALQKGVLAALKANTDLSALVGRRIYDTPPQRTDLPYLRVGRFQVEPWDTDGMVGHEITLGIEAHTRPDKRGATQARRIADVVMAALHRGEDNVAVSGFVLVDLQFLTDATEEAPDAKTYVNRTVFRARLDAAT